MDYFGDLGQGGTSDIDGDGWSLTVEAAHDTHPKLKDEIIRQNTIKDTSVTFDYWYRFYFLSDPYLQVDGIITQFFSTLPPQNGVFHMATNSAPALGDWDGDADLDLFVVAPNSELTVLENIGSKFRMNLKDRSTAFVSIGTLSAGPTIALGDWNNDQNADLAIGYGDGRVRILDSAGTFSGTVISGVDYYIDTGSANAIPAFGDLNGDTNADCIVLLGDGTVRMYPNTGNSTAPFDPATYSDNILGVAVSSGTGLAVGDVNCDGLCDVLVSDDNGRIWVFYGQDSGGFMLLSKVWGGTYQGFADKLTLAIGDLDGDTDIDVIGGYAQGGLVRLTDPRLTPPFSLTAYGGARSILLQWYPNRDADLNGYFIYRSLSSTGSFERVRNNPVNAYYFCDTNVEADLTYYYYVSSVLDQRNPEETVPRYLESRSSNIASAICNRVILWMADYNGRTNHEAVLRVNASNTDGISGQDLDIRITYDPEILKPLVQVTGSNTVERTVLTTNLVISDNGSVANGMLIITGTGGVMSGSGHMFDINFYVLDVAYGSVRTNAFSHVSLRDVAGNTISVDYTSKAIFTVAPNFVMGDVDGDGDVDMADFVLAMQIVANPHQNPTSSQLMAADLNGNGILDKDDAHLILRMLHGKDRNPYE
jgi:hypothetical protein